MKKTILLTGLLFISASTIAQKIITKTYNSNSLEEIYLDLQFAKNIEVQNSNNQDIKVIVKVNIENNTKNDEFSLQDKTKDKILKIIPNYGKLLKKRGRNSWSKINNIDLDIKYQIFCPKGLGVLIKSISGNVTSTLKDNKLKISLVSGKINVSDNIEKIKLSSVSGSIEVQNCTSKIKVNNVSGDISIKKCNSDLKISNVSGNIDVTVYDNTEFKVNSVSGEVFSDLDINFKKKNQIVGTNISGRIGKGVTSLNLKTVSGDIYLRK